MSQSRNTLVLTILMAVIFIFASCNRPTILNDYGRFGGDFTLTDHNGKSFTMSSLKGKLVLLFFGYTHCPDYCPGTLQKLTKVYELLGKKSSLIQIVFVSVDNERDKPAKLKEYLGGFSFNPPIIGLTGSVKEGQIVFKKYGVYHKKNYNPKSKLGYTMDHTSSLFLFDQKNKIRYTFSYHQTAMEIAKVLNDEWKNLTF